VNRRPAFSPGLWARDGRSRYNREAILTYERGKLFPAHSRAAFAALFFCRPSRWSPPRRPGTAPVDGLRDASPRVQALVGGRIVIAPGQVIESGHGRRARRRDRGRGRRPHAAGTAPSGMSPRTVYGRVLESQTSCFFRGLKTLPPPETGGSGRRAARAAPGAGAGRRGAPWNPLVTPERDVARQTRRPTRREPEALPRALGFTTAHIVPARRGFPRPERAGQPGRRQFCREPRTPRPVTQAAAFEHATGRRRVIPAR